MDTPDADRSAPPVLLYHKVTPDWEAGMTWMPPGRFRRQMASMWRRGWRTVLPEMKLNTETQRAQRNSEAGLFERSEAISPAGTLKARLCEPAEGRRSNLAPPSGLPSDYAAHLVMEGGLSVRPDRLKPVALEPAQPRKSFILAFDDGYESIYRHAFPICQVLGFRGLIFMPSALIGRSNDWDYHFFGRRSTHLSEAQIKELLAAGWGIGSHSVDHIPLTGLDSKELRRQLNQSKLDLEDRFGTPVRWVSYPFARYDLETLAASVECGYEGAVISADHGLKPPEGFRVLLADSVYWFDPDVIAARRVERGWSYPLGRRFRKAINWCSGGTILWKKWNRG